MQLPLGAAILAHGLDEVEIGLSVDALLADEHAGLAATLVRPCQAKSAHLAQNLASQLLAAAARAQANQALTRQMTSKTGRHCSS